MGKRTRGSGARASLAQHSLPGTACLSFVPVHYTHAHWFAPAWQPHNGQHNGGVERPVMVAALLRAAVERYGRRRGRAERGRIGCLSLQWSLYRVEVNTAGVQDEHTHTHYTHTLSHTQRIVLMLERSQPQGLRLGCSSVRWYRTENAMGCVCCGCGREACGLRRGKQSAWPWGGIL